MNRIQLTLRSVVVLSIAYFIGASRTWAASHIYLELDGIPGESTREGHKDWIDVKAFDWNESWPTGTNRPTAGPLFLQKSADRSTPLIHQYCATGKRIPSAVMHFSRVSEREVILYRIRLLNVTVRRSESSVDTELGTDDTLSLSYEQIQWTVTQYDIRGLKVADHEAFWNLKLNTTGSTPLPVTLTIQTTSGKGWKISWVGEQGRAYVLLASSRVDTGYQPVAEAVGVQNELIEKILPNLGGLRFFKLETVP
jgi:type VI secretion system secreted protein Hcp